MKVLIVKKYQQFILMLTFLTRIPIKYSFEFDPETFGKGYVFFPVIGAIIGLFLGFVTFVLEPIPVSIKSFLIIISYLLIVGGIHVDGIADLFDGIFSARKRDRILEIMEDSHIGAFGAIGLILYFIGLYIGFEAILTGTGFLKVIICMPIIARSITVFLVAFCKYAKPNGLGKGMVDSIKPVSGSVIMILTLMVMFFVSIKIAMGVLITTVIMGIIVFRIHKALNGITGDVLGATVEISQLIFLMSVSILNYVK